MDVLFLKVNIKLKEKVFAGILSCAATVSVLANGCCLSNFESVGSKNDISYIDDANVSVSYKGLGTGNPEDIVINKSKVGDKFVYNVNSLNTGNLLYNFTSDKDIDLCSAMKTNGISCNQLNAAVGTVVATMVTHQVGAAAAIQILTAAGTGGGVLTVLSGCGDFVALCELMAEGYSLGAILGAGLLSIGGILAISGGLITLL